MNMRSCWPLPHRSCRLLMVNSGRTTPPSRTRPRRRCGFPTRPGNCFFGSAGLWDWSKEDSVMALVHYLYVGHFIPEGGLVRSQDHRLCTTRPLNGELVTRLLRKYLGDQA